MPVKKLPYGLCVFKEFTNTVAYEATEPTNLDKLIPKNLEYFVICLENDTLDISGRTSELRAVRFAIKEFKKRYNIKVKIYYNCADEDEDINISFTEGDDILRSTGALAYGGFPNTKFQGLIRINDAFKWRLGINEGGYKLVQTLKHELGHVFGLKHVNDINDVMHSFYSPQRMMFGDLSKASMKVLYGEKQMTRRLRRWINYLKVRLYRRT